MTVEDYTEYETLCNQIKELNDQIRFAGVISDKGRLLAGGLKKGVESLETPKEDEMLYMELALRVRMRHEFDRQLGPVTFAMALREKALAMSFPLDSDTLYVVAEATANYSELPNNILGLLKK